MSKFSVSANSTETFLRLHMAGELIYETSMLAREELRPFVAKTVEGSQVILFVAEVTRIDSTGFGVLINFVRQVSSRGGRCAVVVDKPFIVDLFRMAKFDQIMPVVATEAQAVEALQASRDVFLSPQEY